MLGGVEYAVILNDCYLDVWRRYGTVSPALAVIPMNKAAQASGGG
jgi:hypothetical protein